MSRLTLAARIAASRFASTRRRATRRAPHVWLPIALRWRRQRKQLEKRRLGRAAAPAEAWLAHVHLHFTLRVARTAVFASRAAATAPQAHVYRHLHTRLRELRRRDEVRAAIAPEAPQVERVLSRHSTVVRSRTVLHAGRIPNPFAAAPSAAPRVADGLRSRPTLLRTRSTSIATRTVRASSIATRIVVDRANRMLFRATRTNVRVSTSATHDRTRSVERLAHIRTRELRIFHRLVSTMALSARNPARESRTSQGVPPGRPPELVWRSAPTPVAESGAAMQHAAIHSAAAQQKPPEAAARTGGAALQLKDFDAPLLDRLTDDVIRRVERRTRVERERRGL